jgi:hypothetical protein
MSKSKLGRNPLAANRAPAAKAATPKKLRVQAAGRIEGARESSVPGFIGNLAAAVVAETVLLGLRTFLLARNTISRRA